MFKNTISAVKDNILLKNSNLQRLNISKDFGSLVSANAGKIIYKEGESSESVYLVISGKVNLIKRNKRGKPSSTIFSENDFFGAKEFFTGINRCSMAFALTDSTLLKLTKREIQYLIEADDKILFNFQRGNKDFKFDQDVIDMDIYSNTDPGYENLKFSEREINKMLFFMVVR